MAKTTRHDKSYSDRAFWTKVKKYATVAGKEVIEKALWLYFVLRKPDVPLWAKSTILGALGYFIFPVDAIPDIVPVVGYADDLGVIALALASVSVHIDKDVKAQARAKLKAWFD